jgi:phosphatidylserine/phosphatidylglycerophosphate/cardiolipin synthase-like enzyme
MANPSLTLLIDGTPKQMGAIADKLSRFLAGAKSSIHIAIYDFRLTDATTAEQIVDALETQAQKGIDVRIAYDHRNAPKWGVGDDPAPHGTHEFLAKRFASGKSKVRLQPIEWTDTQTESIEGSKLMHSKYVIVDGHSPDAAVWMGSTNFTDDAWSRQDNNILTLESRSLSAYYETDFNELWSSAKIGGTGVNDFGTVSRGGIDADISFSPGEGRRIDAEIANLILSAKRSVHIASMVITSDTVLDALVEVLEKGRVPVRGIYDGPQMRSAAAQMKKSTAPASATKVQQIEQLKKVLVAKDSTPFDPKNPNGVHDFMHNKVVVVDDAVITGSYNFSLSAEHNAENALLLRDAQLAETYRGYVDDLVTKYGAMAA